MKLELNKEFINEKNEVRKIVKHDKRENIWQDNIGVRYYVNGEPVSLALSSERLVSLFIGLDQTKYKTWQDRGIKSFVRFVSDLGSRIKELQENIDPAKAPIERFYGGVRYLLKNISYSEDKVTMIYIGDCASMRRNYKSIPEGEDLFERSRSDKIGSHAAEVRRMNREREEAARLAIIEAWDEKIDLDKAKTKHDFCIDMSGEGIGTRRLNPFTGKAYESGEKIEVGDAVYLKNGKAHKALPEEKKSISVPVNGSMYEIPFLVSNAADRTWMAKPVFTHDMMPFESGWYKDLMEFTKTIEKMEPKS